MVEDSWIISSKYSDCSDFPLISSQLVYNDGTLYLFSGYSIHNNTDVFYSKVCSYPLTSELEESQ